VETFRTFIAIFPETRLQKELARIQENLKKAGADIKWVEPENIHLTLKFLGPTPVEKIPSVVNAIRASAKALAPFSISLTHLGAFPNVKHPQIIWVAVTQGKESLKSLASRLDENLKSLGFDKEEREFTAHLTLGRSRSALDHPALSEQLQGHAHLPPMTQEVTQIALIKSTLTSKGPVYEIIENTNLSG